MTNLKWQIDTIRTILFFNNKIDFEKIIEKELKKSCGKSKESEACKNYKESIKDLEDFINK